MGATATTATRSHKRCDVTEQRNRDQTESIGGRFGQDKAGSCCSRRRSIERIVATHNEADGLPRVRCRRGLATSKGAVPQGIGNLQAVGGYFYVQPPWPQQASTKATPWWIGTLGLFNKQQAISSKTSSSTAKQASTKAKTKHKRKDRAKAK